MSDRPSNAPAGRECSGALAPETATDFPTLPSISTGKPYDWALPNREKPLVALPPAAMAERTDPDTAAAFQAALVRAAALFTVISRNNGYEGRDPAVVTDDLDCGLVADLLRIDIDMLARVLVALSAKGLISAHETGGLFLRDVEALDRLSETDVVSTTIA